MNLVTHLIGIIFPRHKLFRPATYNLREHLIPINIGIHPAVSVIFLFYISNHHAVSNGNMHASVMLIVTVNSGSAEIIYFQYVVTKCHLLEASYGHWNLQWNTVHTKTNKRETKCLEQMVYHKLYWQFTVSIVNSDFALFSCLLHYAQICFVVMTFSLSECIAVSNLLSFFTFSSFSFHLSSAPLDSSQKL